MSRQDQSQFLDKLISAEYDKVVASIKKEASTKEVSITTQGNVGIGVDTPTVTLNVASPASMTLKDIRVARRSGKIVKVASRNDLYQDVETKDLWKISDDKSCVVRVFDENNGIVNG